MPKKTSSPTLNDLRKLHPKLRMIRNGDREVNVHRAEYACALCVTGKSLAKQLKKVPTERTELKPTTSHEREEKQRTIPEPEKSSADISAHVFIHTRHAGSPREQPDCCVKSGAHDRKSNLAVATVPITELDALVKEKTVALVELAEPIAPPVAVVSAREVSDPKPARFGFTPQRSRKQVIVGIIDVEGFDFAHEDFLKNGETRWLSIWDQGGTGHPPPEGFDYGAEFTKEHLNAALKNWEKAKVLPQDLERQSEMIPGAHGTHVASIAAGNRGVCPDALLAGVLISIGETDPRMAFYDSTRLAHAVEYLLNVAAKKGLPISINISLGTNGHAHDGSSAISRWIDAALNVPGRCVCVAAGNAGQEIAETPDDYGYVMGRIHTSGRIAGTGLDADLEWIVIGNGLEDASENELELWYSPQDRLAISVKPPGLDWIGPVEPGQFIENRQLSDKSFVCIYNELYHPANGCNYAAVYLSPNLKKPPLKGVRAGQWMVRLHGRDVRDGHFHGWIERDDPRPRGRQGLREFWNFPSFFSERSNVDNSSVGSLGCGNQIITVANLDMARSRIARTSSQGPTRDGRNKPDIAALGTDVIAAKGFAGADDPWVAMSGTSMASPVVAGLAASMLAVDRNLTAAQIKGILHRTAKPLPGGGYEWVNDAGYGQLNAQAALAEVTRAGNPKERLR